MHIVNCCNVYVRIYCQCMSKYVFVFNPEQLFTQENTFTHIDVCFLLAAAWHLEMDHYDMNLFNTWSWLSCCSMLLVVHPMRGGTVPPPSSVENCNLHVIYQ